MRISRPTPAASPPPTGTISQLNLTTLPRRAALSRALKTNSPGAMNSSYERVTLTLSSSCPRASRVGVTPQPRGSLAHLLWRLEELDTVLGPQLGHGPAALLGVRLAPERHVAVDQLLR